MRRRAKPCPIRLLRFNSADASSEAVEELGLIDYLDLVDENFSSLVEITERISNETTTLGQRMKERTKEITEAVEQAPQGQLSRRVARALTGKAAEDMTNYVIRMRTELPLFRRSTAPGYRSRWPGRSHGCGHRIRR